MELQDVLEQRYSCRQYDPEAPSRDHIEAILNAGRLAPTACNYQSQRIFVCMGEENLAKLDECTRCRFGAPVAFIIGYDAQVAAVHDTARLGGTLFGFGELDCTSALVHMALKATDLGLATCWLGAIDDLKLKEVFALPETVNVRAVLVCGKPGEKGVPSPMHTSRKPVEETVSWL